MENLVPVIFIVAGVLVLVMPRLLNFVVALVLILYGLHELNRIHQWAPGLIYKDVPPSPKAKP